MTDDNSPLQEERIETHTDASEMPSRKPWSAPRMTVVPIAYGTEGSFYTGNDGAGTFTAFS